MQNIRIDFFYPDARKYQIVTHLNSVAKDIDESTLQYIKDAQSAYDFAQQLLEDLYEND